MKRSLWLGAAMLAVSSLPAFADTTVNVDLTGDAGDKMGMMLDHDSVPAGKITFVVKNDAMATNHEMVVIKLKNKNDEIPMMKGKHRVDEDKLKSMGEVEDVEPGKSGEMSADLKAGDYLLLCNLKGHFEAGMTSHFTVTK
ncbi:MAG: copper resistance protein [Proteobacteria bacterium]|nr:copper resistance protein [Pseudomonadota bacterium]